MLVLNFLCEQHIRFYHSIWLQVFQTSQFSFFQARRVNICEDHATFQDIEHQLKELSFINIFIIAFYEMFIN